MSIIDNVRNLSVNEFVAVDAISGNEVCDRFQHFADLLTLREDDSDKIMSVLRKIEDMSRDERHALRTKYNVEHENEILLFELCRSFGSFAELRRAFSPIYAYIRSGIAFNATVGEVVGSSGVLTIPTVGEVVAESIGQHCNDASLTMPTGTGEMKFSEFIAPLVMMTDGEVSDMAEEETAQTMLLTASGVPLYPSDFSVTRRDGWCIVSSPVMDLHHGSAGKGMTNYRRGLPATHDKSTNPAKLVSALMNEFVNVLPLSMVATSVIPILWFDDEQIFVSAVDDERYVVEDGSKNPSSDLSTYDLRAADFQ